MENGEMMEFNENFENSDVCDEAQGIEHSLEISREELAKRMRLANENIANALRGTKPVISTPFLTK